MNASFKWTPLFTAEKSIECTGLNDERTMSGEELIQVAYKNGETRVFFSQNSSSDDEIDIKLQLFAIKMFFILCFIICLVWKTMFWLVPTLNFFNKLTGLNERTPRMNAPSESTKLNERLGAHSENYGTLFFL